MRTVAKRLGTSLKQVVRRLLRLLEQREAATPAMPADALELLANNPSARQTTKALQARIRKQRADRHGSDSARG